MNKNEQDWTNYPQNKHRSNYTPNDKEVQFFHSNEDREWSLDDGSYFSGETMPLRPEDVPKNFDEQPPFPANPNYSSARMSDQEFYDRFASKK